MLQRRSRLIAGALNDRTHRFLELRIEDREDGAAAQLPDEAAEPERRQRKRQEDVEPADRQAVRVEFRRDQPEQIDQADDEDAHRHFFEERALCA